MKKTDIIAGQFNQEKTSERAAAGPGSIILEMKRAEQDSRKHTKRMAEFKQLAVLQEGLVHRMLDKSIEESGYQKWPHLTVVK
ncbi:MAG: hypothetical protein ABFS45_11540 [Pseudomonadota bacterium]